MPPGLAEEPARAQHERDRRRRERIGGRPVTPARGEVILPQPLVERADLLDRLRRRVGSQSGLQFRQLRVVADWRADLGAVHEDEVADDRQRKERGGEHEREGCLARAHHGVCLAFPTRLRSTGQTVQQRPHVTHAIGSMA